MNLNGYKTCLNKVLTQWLIRVLRALSEDIFVHSRKQVVPKRNQALKIKINAEYRGEEIKKKGKIFGKVAPYCDKATCGAHQ